MKVACVYDTGSQFTTGVYFDRAFRELGFNIDVYHHNDVKLIPEGYQIYFICDSGPTYAIPKWKSGPSIYYSIDTHLDFDNRFNMAKTATLPIMAQFSCGAQKAVNRGLQTLWIPHACDPWIHQDYQQERTLKVAFVGHLYDDDAWRRTIYNKLKTYGYNDNDIFIGEATKEQMGHIYSAAQVVLNHTVRDNKQDISMRVFEAMSCGAFLITQKLDHNDADKILDHDLYKTYSNDAEMFKEIDEVLTHWNKYKEIAQRGKMFVRTFHTYTKHLEQLLKTIAKMPVAVKEEPKIII